MADGLDVSHLSDEEVAALTGTPIEKSPGVGSSFYKGLVETGPSSVKKLLQALNPIQPSGVLLSDLEQPSSAFAMPSIESVARGVGRPAFQIAGGLAAGTVASPTGPGAIPAAAAGAAAGGTLFDKLLQALGVDQAPSAQEEANKLAEEFGANLSGEYLLRGIPAALGKAKVAAELTGQKIGGPGSYLANKLSQIKTAEDPAVIQATAGKELKNLGQTEESLTLAALKKEALAAQNPAMRNLTTAELTQSPELAVLEKEVSSAPSTGLEAQKTSRTAADQADKLITSLSRSKNVNKATTGEDLQKLFKQKRSDVAKEVSAPFEGEVMRQPASPKGAASEVEDALSSWRQEGRQPVDSKVEKIAKDLKALDEPIEVAPERFGTESQYTAPKPKLEIPDTTVGVLHNIRSRALAVARETKNTQVRAQALAVADVATNKIESSLAGSSAAKEWKTMNANYRDYMDTYYRGEAAKALAAKVPEKVWTRLRSSSGIKDFQKIFGGVHPESFNPAHSHLVDTIVSTYPKTGTVAAKIKWIEKNKDSLEKTGLWNSFKQSKDYFETVSSAKAQAENLGIEHLPISEQSKIAISGKRQPLEASRSGLLSALGVTSPAKFLANKLYGNKQVRTGMQLLDELSKAKNPEYAAELVRKSNIMDRANNIANIRRASKLEALKQELFTPPQPGLMSKYVPPGGAMSLINALSSNAYNPTQQVATEITDPYANLSDEDILKIANQ